LELRLKFPRRIRVECGHHHSRGRLIEPMDWIDASCGLFAKNSNDIFYSGPLRPSALGGMDRDSGRLLEDDKRGILIKNSELFHGMILNETSVHKSAQPPVYWTTCPTEKRSNPEPHQKAIFCFLRVFYFLWHRWIGIRVASFPGRETLSMFKTSSSHKMPHQVTIRREMRISGIGLHSGEQASITLKPALPNTGILFVRKDLSQPVAIPASFEFVTETRLATTLGRGEARISTVEHLLSAFRLMGVDNALVEVDGPEVPIMDGSAAPFCDAILAAGFFDQAVARKVARVKKRIEVRKGDKVALIEPSDTLSIHARIEWNHPVIRAQELDFTLGVSDYREIARARTFGFLKDVECLKNKGLIRGGSYDNAIVLDETSVVNPGGLRDPDEFVRHKVLDAIGDFSLAPIPVVGKVTLHKAGHELHAELIHSIFSSPENYEVKTLDEIRTPVDSSLAAVSALFRGYRPLQGSF
jgi:UDP-3-O-[3-hydroxymyristoyl] N-acetylglucosamine deacetylase